MMDPKQEDDLSSTSLDIGRQSDTKEEGVPFFSTVEDEQGEDQEEEVEDVLDNVPQRVWGSSVYLGSIDAAENKAALESIGIKAILNVSQEAQYDIPEGVLYYKLPLQDISMEDLLDYVVPAVLFIDEALRLGKHILVHWSAAIVMAWMILRTGRSAKEALQYLREVRPWVNPNVGFIKQLNYLESHREAFLAAVQATELRSLETNNPRVSLKSKGELPVLRLTRKGMRELRARNMKSCLTPEVSNGHSGPKLPQAKELCIATAVEHCLPEEGAYESLVYILSREHRSIEEADHSLNNLEITKGEGGVAELFRRLYPDVDSFTEVSAYRFIKVMNL